ncbi:MAG: T9SS type A sorting domain-containing protein [Bacteroidota bacterium]
MKKYHYIKSIVLLVLIFIVVYPVKIYAQSIKLNDSPIATAIAKYWHYRERLKYFVVPGDTYGGGLIAGIRNTINYGQLNDDDVNTVCGASNLDFQEEAVYLGYYLGVLATEYKLLSDQNANYNKTLTDMYYALNAYIEHMDKCEMLCYEKPHNYYDGFFVRSYFSYTTGYIPCPSPITPNPDYFMALDNHLQTFNEGLNYKDNHWYDNGTSSGFAGLVPGQPGFVESVTPSGWEHNCEPMSQDQAIGILTGLALVAHLVPQGLTVYKNDGTLVTAFDLHDKAQEIAELIIKYLGSDPYSCSDGTIQNNWRIYEPGCVLLDQDHGGNTWPFSWGFASAGEAITGKDKWSEFNANVLAETQFVPNNAKTSSSNCWMMSSLAAIADLWSYYDLKDVTNSHDFGWATFYLLLRAVLHDNYDNYYVENIMDDAFDQISYAPCEGPYRYSYEKACCGWCTSYRWHCDLDQQGDGGPSLFYGNYNGLDYMLLLNLYCIVTGNSFEYNTRPLDGVEFPIHMPMVGVIGDASYPVYVASETNIESNAKFHNYVVNMPSNNTPAYGTYKAKNSIILKPGFKVEAGAYFQAMISEDIGCYDIWISWKESNQNNDSTYAEANDNIILNSLPKEKDSLSVYPNPNNGNMSVNYNLIESETGTFILYDLLGKELFNFPLFSGMNTFTITSETLDKGMYIYRAYSRNKQIASDKIVVIK